MNKSSMKSDLKQKTNGNGWKINSKKKVTESLLSLRTSTLAAVSSKKKPSRQKTCGGMMKMKDTLT